MSAVNPLVEPGDDTPPVSAETAPEPAPAPAPEKAEAKEEPKPEVTTEEKYQNLQKALQEERRERQRIRDELERVGKQNAELARIKEELDSRRKEAQAQKEAQAFQDNPAEYLKTQVELTQQQLQEVTENNRKAAEEAARQNELAGYISSQVHEFSSKTPDYNEAFDFLRQRSYAIYEALGIPEEHRASRFDQESWQLAAGAAQNGKNPAEVAYAYAKAFGYTSKPAAPNPAANPEKVIERLEQGHKAAQSLSGGRGESSVLKQIDEMSDAEFDKYWETNLGPHYR